MNDLNKILVPTDFSDGSAAALKYACQLAEALHADITVLHALEPPSPLGTGPEFYTPPREYFARRENEARNHLDSVLSPEQRQRYHAELVLRHGTAAAEILRYLYEHAAVHLVIMATHGRGGVARLMVGSVADQIMRQAPCPVLTLRAAESREPAATAA
jgi:universal stress protein A